MPYINLHENGHTFIASIEADKYDDERIVCALFERIGTQGYACSCIAVGDGAYREAAIEDALWDALGELAHVRSRQASSQ